MDEELTRLDLAIADARDMATELIAGLRKPQEDLRTAAGEFVETVATRRVDATRRASVAVMARMDDDDLVDLRLWVDTEVERVREEVERDIETRDFWVPQSTGMSIADVGMYGAALVPRPKDTPSGIPQSLDFLFERALYPLQHGLATAGLRVELVEGDPRKEQRLLRAWRIYKERAVECLAVWADIDTAYQDSSARFQDHRWERAAEADRTAFERRLAEARSASRTDALEPDDGTARGATEAAPDEADGAMPRATPSGSDAVLAPTS